MSKNFSLIVLINILLWGNSLLVCNTYSNFNATYGSQSYNSSNSHASGNGSFNPLAVVTTFASIFYVIRNFINPVKAAPRPAPQQSQNPDKGIPYFPDDGRPRQHAYPFMPQEPKSSGPQIILPVLGDQKKINELVDQQRALLLDSNNTYVHKYIESRIVRVQRLGNMLMYRHGTTHFLNDRLIMQLKQHEISVDKFAYLEGNQLQDIIHKELISILETAGSPLVQSAIATNKSFGHTLYMFAEISCDYNKNDDLIKALSIADWCWGAVAVLENIGKFGVNTAVLTTQVVAGGLEGVGRGVMAVGYHALHPVEWATGIRDGLVFLVKSTARIMVEVSKIEYLIDHDPEEARLYYLQLGENAHAVAQVLMQSARNVSAYGAASQTTATLTESFIEGKIFHKLGLLFNTAYVKSLQFAKEYKNKLMPATEVIAVTAEGLEVAIVREVMPLLKSKVVPTKQVPTQVLVEQSQPQKVVNKVNGLIVEKTSPIPLTSEQKRNQMIAEIMERVHFNDPRGKIQFSKLQISLMKEEFTSIIGVTKHGLERLIERGFQPYEVLECLNNPTLLKIQNDGARVFIKEIGNNFYNYMVINDQSGQVVSCLKGVDMQCLMGLSKNYGWGL